MPPTVFGSLYLCEGFGAVGDGGGAGGGIWEGGRGSARLTNKYAKLLSFFFLKEEKRDLHEQYNILVCK